MIIVVFKATHNLKQFTFYSHRKKWCKNKYTHEQGFQNSKHLPSTQSHVFLSKHSVTVHNFNEM